MKIASQYEPSPSLFGTLRFLPKERQDVVKVVVVLAPAECSALVSIVLAPLQTDLPAAIVILVHETANGDRSLASNLAKIRFPVESGANNTQLRNGHAVVLAADAQLYVGKFDRLSESENLAHGPVPTVLLRSIVTHYRENVLGVVLTSLEQPEVEAVQMIRANGGRTIALDRTDRAGLDQNAPNVAFDVEDICLGADAIGPRIASMIYSRSA